MRNQWLMIDDELGILADTGWMDPAEARAVADELHVVAARKVVYPTKNNSVIVWLKLIWCILCINLAILILLAMEIT